MKNKIQHYAHVNENTGKVGRLARINFDGFICEGWDDGAWVPMPGLIKIVNDITDYKEVTEEEAKAIIASRSQAGSTKEMRP